MLWLACHVFFVRVCVEIVFGKLCAEVSHSQVFLFSYVNSFHIQPKQNRFLLLRVPPKKIPTRLRISLAVIHNHPILG